MLYSSYANSFCISAQDECISEHNALNLCKHLCLYAQVHKLCATPFAPSRNTLLMHASEYYYTYILEYRNIYIVVILTNIISWRRYKWKN